MTDVAVSSTTCSPTREHEQEPVPLDAAEVHEQVERRPAAGHDTAPRVRLRHPVDDEDRCSAVRPEDVQERPALVRVRSVGHAAPYRRSAVGRATVRRYRPGVTTSLATGATSRRREGA